MHKVVLASKSDNKKKNFGRRMDLVVLLYPSNVDEELVKESLLNEGANARDNI